ncbi:MAG: hypothetical protein ACRER1_05670 [Gammaproteobacteria bacterium]
MLLTAGCNDNGAKVSAPLAAITPIANCIVDSENDVEIGGPDANPGCQNVEMEPSSTNPSSFDEIRIEDGGILTILGGASSQADTSTVHTRDAIPTVPLETPVREICVGNGGTLQFDQGTADKPITNKNKVILEFLGSRHSANPEQICKQEPTFKKGIDVETGGSLLMYGAKGVPSRDGVSWTTLAAPAGSQIQGAKVKSTGTTTLKLTADVTKGLEGWEPGDWIVVATTDYVPFHSEFVQIVSVKSNSGDGSTVTLMQPLKHYHFGSPAPSTGTCTDRLGKTEPASFCDGADKNYGVDERAEVGLISRDIELVSDVPEEADSLHWGGEIMIHAGFKKVAIQGVRLSKFGKDQLGSYPIHFHMVGDIAAAPNPGTANALIDADSIDHSYNKCITIHNTANLTIQNNVCARIVGHIFYEELDSTAQADDGNIVFKNNLGLGAMSNSFDIHSVTVGGKQISRDQLIKDYWWTGDYMTNSECATYSTCNNYDGFNIPDTDDWHQPTHGSCTKYGHDGGFAGYQAPNQDSTTAACPPKDPNLKDFTVYIEPASGFWIQNPDTTLIGNAIGGCQGVGRGVWWVPPLNPITADGKSVALQFQPLGPFKDNRVHACYSGFYGEGEYSVISGQLFPHKDGTQDSPAIVATLDGMTATRNRFRGVWLRPVWFVIKNGRFASNRENVSLVTSGGIDGNAPGVWDLLEDSTIVGFSRNNVERWGPCPQGGALGPNTGAHLGCIDHTPPDGTPNSGSELGQGYTPPSWNDFGYMLYDGPVRVYHDRFVNFNYDNPNGTGKEFSSQLDDADKTFLADYETHSTTPTGKGPPAPYEGDAAFGWFQSNQSAYPTGTASKELMWDNTNLRHQIYTEDVSVNTNFNDGDKNTAIIDEDGTLTGLGVIAGDPAKQPNPIHAISLNNLPFNGSSNSVDECLSRGGQNELYEGRDTSLMSPAEMGTLEVSNLYPFIKVPDSTYDYPGGTNTHWQDMTFRRDDAVPLAPPPSTATFHPTMVMKTGRNGLGIWEPKVSNGYGYTATVQVTTAPAVPPDQNSHKAGVWKWIELGLADVVDRNISADHPFFIQLGINYTNKDGSHPANDFTITRGYKSYVGGNTWQADLELLKYWTPLVCNNLDSLNVNNVPWSGNSFKGACPAGDTSLLSKANSIAELTKSDGTPDLSKYYYDTATGYLYFNVAQDEPNPVAPSPIGSCANGADDPSCPDVADGESYYACPKNGCIIYAIAQNDDNYDPGPSVGQPDPANAKAAPANPNQLVVYGTNTVIEQKISLDKQGIPYHTATNGPVCTVTEPPQP